MSKFRAALPLIVLFAFTDCFQILHYLTLNEDGSTDIHWRFAISKSLAEKGKPGPGEGGKESVEDKIAKSEQEVRAKFKEGITNLRVNKIETEFEIGLDLEFHAKDLNKVVEKTAGDEGFSLVPRVGAGGKELVFAFKQDADKKKKDKDKKADGKKKPGPGEDTAAGNDDEAMDKNFEEIGNMIMSSARYQLFLGGKYIPVSAVVKGKSSKKTLNLSITRLGSMYLIDFPFMSIHQKENDGYDLVVTLK